MKKQNTGINLIMISVILLFNTLTLVYSRKHYDMFYKSVYKQILTDYEKIKKDNSHTVYIIDSNKKITDYYISKLDIDTGFVNYSNRITSYNVCYTKLLRRRN